MQNIGYIMVACLLAPFGFIPLRWSQAIGAKLGLLLITYNRKRAHIARCNIKACFPDKTDEEREQLLRDNAMESGKWFMESAYVWFRHPNYLINRVSVKNPEVLKAAHEQQRGVIIVLPHIGNWELLNFYVPQHYPFAAMYKPIKSTWFEKIIFRSRSRLGTSMFPTNAKGVRQALKSMRNNHVLAILSDHLPSRKAGVYAPFFNRPALTGKLTHSLVNSNQSEAVLASVLRKPKGQGFEIIFQNIDDIHNKDSIIAATAINRAIEKSIIHCPEQYQWVYRRFAHPPQGEKNIYSDN